MEKHKEVFFVIRLHSTQSAASLPPINDPDASLNCDLMDGRDAFLTLAREKHFEFSSLRRAKFSTMALLYELHNSGTYWLFLHFWLSFRLFLYSNSLFYFSLFQQVMEALFIPVINVNVTLLKLDIIAQNAMILIFVLIVIIMKVIITEWINLVSATLLELLKTGPFQVCFFILFAFSFCSILKLT